MKIEIRKARPDEAEKIIDISIEVWNTTYKGIIPQDTINKLQSKDTSRIERQRKNIEENDNIYVALVDGKIVGFHTYGKAKDERFNSSGEIYAGYIKKEYQGLGLGRKMAVACMKELQKEGYNTMITKCLLNNPSNEFHKSLGGILIGKSPFEALGIYVGEENIYYHENLDKSLEYNLEKINKKLIGEKMKIIRKNETFIGTNNDECHTIEYSFNDKQIDLCIATIKGRYPKSDYCVNLVSKELIYIIEGSGKIYFKDKTIKFDENDAILIDKNEKYYWESTYCKASITCTPAWSKEQYKIVK